MSGYRSDLAIGKQTTDTPVSFSFTRSLRGVFVLVSIRGGG